MSLFSLLADILFIGHSLVGPALPPMTEAALARMGAPARVEAQIINGAPLAYNWDHSADAEGVDGKARLAAGVDVLILTEAIPLAQQVEWNDTAGKVADFAALAAAARPGVQVFLYETWHSLASGPGTVIEGDAGAATPWRQRLEQDLVVWEQVAADASARGVPVSIVPAGQAMGLMADEIAAGRVPGLTDIRDLFADDIHPNGKGLYLVAMVQAAAITGKSPEGLPARLQRAWLSRDAVITDDMAGAMQRVAWAAVQAQSARKRPAPSASAAPPPAPAPASLAPPDGTTAAPALPDLAPIRNPNLALGLEAISDWSVQQPFLDIMKTARPWTGHLPGQWGGLGHDDLDRAGHLSPEGWPLIVPDGVTGLSALMLTDLPPDAGGVAGRYRVTYQGKGVLVAEGRAQDIRPFDGGLTFDFTPGDGSVILTIVETDPADPIRDIVVVREDRAALLAGGRIFNPDWLDRIRGVRGIRLMGWMATNDSTVAMVEDRPRPADYTWGRVGVPMEVMIALANELQAEPWFCIPHQADDALVRELAILARDGLDPGLRAWVEYSNEVWNWQFSQARWAEEQGKARWGQDQTWVQFYALRAAEVAGIWAEVFGNPDRLVRVLATQTGYLGLEAQILDAPLVMAEGRPAPATAFDAYAVTGYFSALLGADHKHDALADWIRQSENAAAEAAKGAADPAAHLAAHRFDLATALALQDLRDGSVTGDAADSLTELLGTTLPYHAALAADRGLKLVMYEGGTHVVGFGAQVDEPWMTEFFHHLNYSPGMGALYADLLAGWARMTDAPFNAFVDVQKPSKWGSWGALRHLGDDNPRWQALAAGCAGC